MKVQWRLFTGRHGLTENDSLIISFSTVIIGEEEADKIV